MIEELTTDIRRWTAPHPEWRPRIAWAQEVACFAVTAGDDLLLVDPLAPADEEPFWTELDRLVADSGARRLAVLITIHYHVRSAGPVYRRYRDRLDVSVHGHPSISDGRLGPGVPLTPIEPGEPLPGGAEAFAIGKPRRRETPIYLPSARALAFGDAVVGVDGELRVWENSAPGRTASGTSSASCPRCAPCSTSIFENVLVTHGPPVIGGGRDRLRRGLEAPPWSMRSG